MYTAGCAPIDYLYMWGKLNMFLSHSLNYIDYPDLKINNFIIDRVADFNLQNKINCQLSLVPRAKLTVNISSDLKWHKHIEHISLKISKVIEIMYRIKSILQANILLTMYLKYVTF